MHDVESVGVLEKKYSRRTFIKGVIATGATVSSANYLFRGTNVLGAATAQSTTERLLTLTTVSVPHPRAFLTALTDDPEQRAKSLYMRDFAQPGYDATLLADDAAGLRALFGGLPQVDVAHVVAAAREPGALAAWLRWYAAQRREDVVDTPAVTVPTLYVWSDQDLALGRAAAEGTAAWVCGAYRFEVLAGVSHWVPEQAADRLGPLLVDHLGAS